MAQTFPQLLNSEKVAPKVAIILFLNKKDVFEQKIKKVPIKKWYKEYKGGDDFDQGVAFFKQMFLSRVSDDKKRDEIFTHVTCAVDPESPCPLFVAQE